MTQSQVEGIVQELVKALNQGKRNYTLSKEQLEDIVEALEDRPAPIGTWSVPTSK